MNKPPRPRISKRSSTALSSKSTADTTVTETTTKMSNTKEKKFQEAQRSARRMEQKQQQPVPITPPPPSSTPRSVSSNSAYPFQVMEIKVTVMSLSGIVTHHNNTKRKFSLSPLVKKVTSNSPRSIMGFGPRNDSANSMESTSNLSANSSNSNTPEKALPPIFALASFTRNSLSSDISITTHVPSSKLDSALECENNTARYNAFWPVCTDTDVNEENVEKSSVTFRKLLRRENLIDDSSKSFSDESSRNALSVMSSSNDGSFTPEVIDMNVGLISGGEMMTIGTTSFVVSGETFCKEIHLPLAQFAPTKAEKKQKQSLKFTPGAKKRIQNARERLLAARSVNSTRTAAFAHDPSNQYSLHKNASIRIMLTVAAHGTVDLDTLCLKGLSLKMMLNNDSARSIGAVSGNESTSKPKPKDVSSPKTPPPKTPPSPKISTPDVDNAGRSKMFCGINKDKIVPRNKDKSTGIKRDLSIVKNNLTQRILACGTNDFDDDSDRYVGKEEIEDEVKEEEVIRDDNNYSLADFDFNDQSNIEIGTDNVATLWKTSPSDYFCFQEYTTPKEPSYSVRKSVSFGGRQEIIHEDHPDDCDETCDTTKTPQNCGVFDMFTCKQDGDIVDKMADLLARSESDDEYTYDDNTFLSDDDDMTYDTYDSKFISVGSADDSMLSGSYAGHSNKRMSEAEVKKARETLRRFATRIGVDPEDLI